MESQQADLNRVEGALVFIPSDCSRIAWVRILMGIKSEFGEAGRDLAERWSEGGDSYNKKDFNDTWRSIKEDGRVNIGTVFYEAEQNGWTDDSKRKPTPPTPEKIAQREAKRKAAEDERKARREKAAIEALAIWNKAPPAPADHPYFKRKGIQPHGTKVYHGDKIIGDIRCDGALLVPMYLNRKVTGLQFITEEGKKLFLPGAEKGGCMIGKAEPGKPFLICEGFATGATIHEATGYPVIVAFDAGNLCKMVVVFRDLYPDSMIILCADDDHKTPGNPGKTKATEAARLVDGYLALPEFGEGRPEGATDFNDMEKHCGLEAVKQVIDAAIQANQNHDPAESGLNGLDSADDTNTAPTTGGTIAGDSGDSFNEVIAMLAAMPQREYIQQRKDRAKVLNIGVGMLDKLVKAEQSEKAESSRLPFKEVEPCLDPVDPAQLLDEVKSTIRRFVILTDEQATAAALWVAVTWFSNFFQTIPLIIITAPEKSSGKTQLLLVISRMVFRPLLAANASASALFRAVEAWTPTILIDEADTFFRDNIELHGMINAGHSRDGFVLRSEAVGDSFKVRSFPVFCPKALAGIGLGKHLPDATMSRGIVLELLRKLKTEFAERLRHAEPGLFENLTAKLARFALDYSDLVRKARPALPGALSDRDMDNWEPLLVIASIAGNEWLKKATAATLALSKVEDKPVSIGNELLEDIRHIFENKKLENISTAELIKELCRDDEAPWLTYNKSGPITPRQVARLLKAYGISSKNIRSNSHIFKGFEVSQFNDVFERFLNIPSRDTPGNYPLRATKPIEANNHGAFSVADDVAVAESNPLQNATVAANNPLHDPIRYASATPEPPSSLRCSGVADKTAVFGGVDEGVSI